LDSDGSDLLSGRCELGSESADLIEVGEFLGQRSKCQLIQKGRSPWNMELRGRSIASPTGACSLQTAGDECSNLVCCVVFCFKSYLTSAHAAKRTHKTEVAVFISVEYNSIPYSLMSLRV
jgi:hypothetical protein